MLNKILIAVILVNLFLLKPNEANAAKVDTMAIRAIFIEAMEIQDYDLDSSFRLAQKGYLISKKSNYLAGIGMAFMRMAAIMNIKGKNDSSLLYYHEGLNIRKKLNDYHGASGICKGMSYVFRDLGARDSSFYYLFEALRYSDLTKDSSKIAVIFVELAHLYTQYGNFNTAKTYLDKALPIFSNLKDSSMLFQINVEYGNLNFLNSKNEIALKYFLIANQLNKSLNNDTYQAKIYNFLALCYHELNNHQLAKSYYKQSIQGYQDLGLVNELALGYFNLANLFIDIKEADSAIYYLNKSITIARTIKDQHRIKRSYELLSDAYALKGNYLKAYHFHVAYSTLNDSLLNSEKVSQIAEMQTKYQTEKKEQQINLLAQENKAKVAERNFFIIGSVLLLISLIIFILYYFQRNKINKQQEVIAQKRIENLLSEQEIKSYNAMIEGQEVERQRIATDLHDRLGSMLSTVKLLFSTLETKIDRAQDDQSKQYEKANSLLDEACIEVRRISHNLSTGMVATFGLTVALDELCESINESKLIQCKLLIYGAKERLDQQTEINIYRMIQEIINNILKHAKAKSIIIQLNQLEDSLNITIEDDGIGFDVEEKKKNGGLGLGNLSARASKLNGTYNIDSNIGIGTISIIDIPLK